MPNKSELIPPLEECNELELYEEVVQKTYGRYPLVISHGKGCVLYDSNKKSYLDFVAGIATCALGHSNKELSKAIQEQMKTVHHVSNLYFIKEQALLAKFLTDNSVGDKVFFCNSGAEANEAAIKLARKYAFLRGKKQPVIITAKNSFHGRTLAAISATGQPKYHFGFGYGGEMVQGFEYVNYNNIEELTELANKHSDNLAAIMLEPLQGEGGIVPGTLEFFQKAREICDETSSLLILDEVQTGMGRTSKMWGYEHLGIKPDVFTSAKALGAGVPIGAMIARGDAADTFGPGDHASTFGGNPLACAAGLAVAKYFCDYNVLENVQERGNQLSQALTKIVDKYPEIEEVRGWGLLQGVSISEDSQITASDVVAKAMDKGLLLVPAGLKVVRFVPPLIVSQEEIQQAVDIFETSWKDLQ